VFKNRVKLHLFIFIGTVIHPEMQEIRITGFVIKKLDYSDGVNFGC